MGLIMYGREWQQEHPLEVELLCFFHDLKPEQGGLGKAGHFWKIAELLWPEGSHRQFIWNPWSAKMIEEACKWKFLSVSGPASASKSETFAAWSIINFIADAMHTTVLITSTSLKDSRNRIWGSIEEMWAHSQVKLEGVFGKLTSSTGLIRAKGASKSGIILIAGEKKKESASIGKLIGIKNNNVFLIGDELPELSPGLVTAAVGNLNKNDRFQFVGIGNPNSRFDPHGDLSEPEAGWKSITDKDTEWKTKLGYAIRFDSLLSPNILAGKTLYKFLPTQEKIDEDRKNLGENSLSFWRMCRGFWCPEGASEGVYSEVDITSTNADSSHVDWASEPITVAGLDLAYTTDGDFTQLMFGKFGTDRDGKKVLLFTDAVSLKDDQRVQVSRNDQIVDQIIAECVRRGVSQERFGLDITAGGSVFAELLSQKWGGGFHHVDFAGSPTEMTVLASNSTPANQLYFNRVSELWGVGVDYLRAGQIRGVKGVLATQMTARKQTTVKRGDNTLLKVECKRDMRKRTGYSPDVADAAFILLDLLRSRFSFRALQSKVFNERRQRMWRELLEQNRGAMAQPRVGAQPGRPAFRMNRVKPVVIVGGGWGNARLR